MHCVNCGTELYGEQSFCPRCGWKITGYMPTDYYSAGSRIAVRQLEMNEVNNMIAYFSQKNDLYAEYDRLCERLDPRYRKKKVGLLVGGIIVSVVAFFLLLMGTIDGGTPVPGIIMFLGSATMIFFFVFTSMKRNANYAETCDRFDAVSNELYEHYLNYGPCLVSAEYTNPANLYAILETMHSGRADTIKEAVNILIEDAHRNNMEAYARSAAISADNAARGAAVSAVFAAANLFIRR